MTSLNTNQLSKNMESLIFSISPQMKLKIILRMTTTTPRKVSRTTLLLGTSSKTVLISWMRDDIEVIVLSIVMPPNQDCLVLVPFVLLI
jgi:hypothetical protein